MVQKIVQSGDPVLRLKAKKVGRVDAKIKNLIKDLYDTLAVQKEPEGVGLAAPQIGRSLRVFLAKYKKLDKIVINPEIVSISNLPHTTKKPKGSKKEILEGCLSLPHYYGPLKRSEEVTLKYLNAEGNETTETFTGFDAQIMLHEIDHLNGILFIDHILKEKKPLYHVEGDKWEEIELIP